MIYQPLFNQVLVEVDTESDKWGTGNDDSMLGKDYREGTVISYGPVVATNDYPEPMGSEDVVGKHVMWNQGHEAGKTFEHDGKLYAFVYWWDLVAVKSQDK